MNRTLALIGAVVLAIALGALVALYQRGQRPTETAAARPAAENLVTRTTSLATFRIPLPAGHCALDAARPEDNAILTQMTRAMRNNATADAVVFSVPCDRRGTLTGTDLPPDLRIMAFAAVRPPGAARELVNVSRPDFLARLRARAGAASDGFARGSGGRDVSARHADDDENAYYLSFSGLPTGGAARGCGIMAMTTGGGALIVQLLMENCDTASVQDSILPLGRQLAARFAALNP